MYTGMFQMMVCENEEYISFLIELNDGILQRSSDEEKVDLDFCLMFLL